MEELFHITLRFAAKVDAMLVEISDADPHI